MSRNFRKTDKTRKTYAFRDNIQIYFSAQNTKKTILRFFRPKIPAGLLFFASQCLQCCRNIPVTVNELCGNLGRASPKFAQNPDAP